MDIRHLKTFIAIVDQGTFGKAGNIVGLTQSAVSQQVQAIETFLNIKLFDRTKRPPQLTAQGNILLEGARRIITEYDHTTSKVASEQISGSLILGVVPTSFSGVLPEALSILRSRYPKLKIHIDTVNVYNAISKINTGQIDSAIVPESISNREQMTWMPFSVEPLKVIADKSAEGSTDKELLENSPYIRFTKKVPVRALINKEILRRGIKVSDEMFIDTFAAIIRMVSYGLGVSVVPEHAVKDPFPPNIKTVPFGDPPLRRVLGVICKETSASKKKILLSLHRQLVNLCGFSSSKYETGDF